MQVKSFGQDLEKDHFSYFIPKKNVSTNVIFGKLSIFLVGKIANTFDLIICY